MNVVDVDRELGCVNGDVELPPVGAITTLAITRRCVDGVASTTRSHQCARTARTLPRGPGQRGVDVNVSPKWEESSLSWIFSITLPSSRPVDSFWERRWETTAKSWFRGQREPGAEAADAKAKGSLN